MPTPQLRELAALVATRRNPVIQAFYQRLLAMHKPKQVALTACMHKLLTILNAMARRLDSVVYAYAGERMIIQTRDCTALDNQDSC